jgi:hypothetical protein
LIGLGPLALRPDDESWVIENAAVPFILMRDDDGGCFGIVGDCYVHGGMEVKVEDEEFSKVELQ